MINFEVCFNNSDQTKWDKLNIIFNIITELILVFMKL